MRNKKRRNFPLIENAQIIDMAAEGKSIVRHEDMVIFVDYGAPGDVVDIQIVSKKKNFAEAKIVNFKKYSSDRTDPVCQHFGVCGGCKWQHIPYEKQVNYKHQQVIDSLKRIGKIDVKEILPPLGSSKNHFYRNKLDFTFSNKRWLLDSEKDTETSKEMNALGFHVPGRFDKILDIEKCFLQEDPSNAIRLAVREYALKNNLEFFDIMKQTGFLRNLIIRTSSIGQTMVIVQVFQHLEAELQQLLAFIVSSFPQINSLMYVVNTKGNETFHDLEVVCYKGKSYIEEQMEDLTFKIGPKSFYQTNSHQAFELYKIAREFAQLKGNEIVYDLYTGVGTIANFVAKSCKKVVGIEYVPQAIEDAKENSSINNVLNTTFYAGDMKLVLNLDLIHKEGKPDIIITDPPRAGMDTPVLDQILATEVERIVYISCNPATQARDLAYLSSKYEVLKSKAVDMFPHTHHIENVVLLQLIKAEA